MSTYNPNLTTYPSSHQGNMTMCSNQFSSLNSLSPLNCDEIPPHGDRNEMVFIPPLRDSLNLPSIDGQLDNMAGNFMANPVSGERNFKSQGLSLSLGTQMTPPASLASIHYQNQNPNLSFSSSFVGMHLPNSGEKCEVFRNMGMHQYEPTGFADAIVNSKYLRAVQQLLDEVANVRKALKQPKSNKDQSSHRSDGRSNGVQSNATESIANSGSELSPAERQDLQNKKAKLLSMLDEVDRKYRQYCHQMQIVASSFDAVAGPGAAKLYTALALQTISRQFRSLRDAINGQIQATRRSLGEADTSSSGGAIPRLRFVDHQLRQQKALQQLGVMRPAWRPQRGLPESSVSILRAWLFEHFLHPYPNDSEKIMLARQTGLTRNQVANWFINARVRLWKPMVEEMYKEEFGDSEVTSKSSPENAPKACNNNYNPSALEDTQQESQGTSKPATSDNVPPDIERETNKPTPKSAFGNGSPGENVLDYGTRTIQDNQRPNMNDHRIYQNGMSQLSGFTVSNQMSLALGLRHCEKDMFSLPGGDNMGGNNKIASPVGNDTGDYHCIDLSNQQDRFSNSHLLHDFVV